MCPADVPVCRETHKVCKMVIRRRLRIQGPGLAFVTTAVKEHLPVFSHQSAADTLIQQLRETLSLSRVSLAGYVLMPSHLHLLIGMERIEGLSKFVQSLKSLTSRKIKALDLPGIENHLKKGAGFRLWRPRFDDLIIHSERQFKVKLDYIHNNPVKAGLVSKAVDWKYSSASDWLEDQPGLIKIDKEFTWTS